MKVGTGGKVGIIKSGAIDDEKFVLKKEI